jgi:ArsR family transcriptional regulator
MDSKSAAIVFECLASSIRLDIYRLLVRKGLQGEVAGRISTRLGVPASNLSFHLKALTQVGLVTVDQEGRFQRYRAHLPLMIELVTYLTEECCSDDHEPCAQVRLVGLCSKPKSKRKRRAGV